MTSKRILQLFVVAIAALASSPSALAQTSLYEEIMLQTDTVQLLYSNSRRLLANRLSIGLFDDLLEIVDLAERKINSIVQRDTTQYIQPHITIANQRAKIAFCLLNGDYGRFFDMLERFTNEWVFDRLQYWAERYIADNPQKWLQWAETHPMTEEQRLAALAYLYDIGIEKNTDKAHINCSRIRRKLAGSKYAAFAKHAEKATSTMSLDFALGASAAHFNGTLANLAGSSVHWGGHVELSFHLNRVILGLCATILTADYIGEPLLVENKYGSFVVQPGTNMNLNQTVLYAGYKISMPRRINFYALGEIGAGGVNVPTIKVAEKDVLEVIPRHLVLGAALRAEIGLVEWKDPVMRHGFRLVIDAGVRTTPRYGSALRGTAALVWYFGG